MVHLLEFPEGMLWMGSAYFKTRAPGCAYIFCFSLFFFSIPFIFALSFSLPPCRNSDPGSHSRLFSPSTHYGSCLAFFSREDFSSSLVDSRRIGVFIYIYIPGISYNRYFVCIWCIHTLGRMVSADETFSLHEYGAVIRQQFGGLRLSLPTKPETPQPFSHREWLVYSTTLPYLRYDT